MARKSSLTEGATMSVMGHVQELQKRLVISAVFLITGASLAYAFRDQLIHILLEPLKGQPLMYLNPAGGFSFILLVSVYAGLALAAPITIYQVFCFVRPILSKRAQKNSFLVLISSLILLAGGVAFGYIFAIPGALNFLYEFAGDYVQASLTADSYLNFVVAYTLGLGLVFQVPILLMLIHWINPLTPSGLLKSERWVILGAFIAAAIITPTPDPLNQTIIALPIIVVYQLGVVAVLVSVFREKRSTAKMHRRQAATATPDTPAVPTPTPDMPAGERPIPRLQSVAGVTRTLPSAKRRVAAPQPVVPHAAIARPAVRKGQAIDGFLVSTGNTERIQAISRQRVVAPRMPRPSHYPARPLPAGPRAQISTTAAGSGRSIDGLSRVATA